MSQLGYKLNLLLYNLKKYRKLTDLFALRLFQIEKYKINDSFHSYLLLRFIFSMR